jgi:hypothetical protein
MDNFRHLADAKGKWRIYCIVVDENYVIQQTFRYIKKPLEEMTGNSSRNEAECTTKQTNVQSSYKKPLKTFKLFLL